MKRDIRFPAAALVAINGIREEQFQVNTVDFRVKAGLDSVLGAAATINDASATRAQLQSPSLRMLANLDVEPIIAALLFGSLPVVILYSFFVDHYVSSMTGAVKE